MIRGVLRLTPQMPQRGSRAQQRVGEHRLVATVERAESQMHDADADVADVVAGLRHLRRKPRSVDAESRSTLGHGSASLRAYRRTGGLMRPPADVP